ncbi:hypothetical protein [Glaciibacter psychrotolerans]|uniref:Uncharacterized protein n=1 Tax=Glaciibacter psychrotolerans TaxID=670054 RepID=A0A7Z0ECP6_9MICO|nr:hypothetical protein [Leifsonia psychrotolerans]NYJ19194.1 hypothetical protein [Leifsonia psychrotolerans]
MADTGRSVVGADIAQRPTLTGYVRMLNAPSCSRCVILAGKWFRWNQGFQRHPRCDCRHIPASENVGGDLRTDPYAYFNSLTPEAQTKAFGRIEARSIQDGGDIYRAVNIKARGLGTAKSNLRYGTPSKMTIDDIYRTAGTRSNAIRMMTEQGYITGPQTAGGNIFGRMRESYSVPISRPIVAGSNRDRVLTARSTGVRDPLDRATMTAAERRLFDAQYRLSEARTTGYWPRSVGANSADLFSLRTPLAPGDLALLETVLQKEIAKLPNAADSVRRLASLLRL